VLEVLLHRTWSLPVPEAVSIALRIPTQHGNKRKDDQTYDDEYLEQLRDELRLAIILDGEDVERHRECQSECNSDPGIKVRPEADHSYHSSPAMCLASELMSDSQWLSMHTNITVPYTL
jgi:hypothetical protein